MNPLLRVSLKGAPLSCACLLVFSLAGCGGVDTAKALWAFTQDHPDVSPFILLEINEDESKVPEYALPPLLYSASGDPITSVEQWQQHREELLLQFAEHIYGSTPGRSVAVKASVIDVDKMAVNGNATRKQVVLDLDGHKATLLIYTPNKASGPVPAFLILNFKGNHTISGDPAVLLTNSWVPVDEDHGVFTNEATDANRGQRARRYPVDTIIGRGYALVTAYYGDFYPDHRDGQANSVHSLFVGDTSRAQWGAIGAWSWGMSRILDYLETDEYIDASRVISAGHSRLGKAALWAAAQDERFAGAISNNSGAVGAALSRRQFGETVNIITAMFPHWFTGGFADYAGRESSLPVDQHQLLALIAPRPVYVASASKDHWADPKGEFLAASAASGVYEIYNIPTADLSEMPDVQGAISGPVSFHVRAGKHDLLPFDWEHYLDFADCQILAKEPCS